MFQRFSDRLVNFLNQQTLLNKEINMPINQPNSVLYSVLDLATVIEGKTPADSFHNSLALAKAAEQLGYTRYWFAEHHNMASVASSATSVLIGYVAGGTKTIRVGSGGIM